MTTPRIERLKKAGLWGCFDGSGVNSTNYKDVLMSDCTDSGCRNLEWKCADCGRTASTARLAPTPGFSEWISVKDRLPEPGQKVIFYVSEREESFAGSYVVDDYRSTMSGKFRENLDWWWFDEEPITHWMPLAEAPK